jgi:hypothetical protein
MGAAVAVTGVATSAASVVTAPLMCALYGQRLDNNIYATSAAQLRHSSIEDHPDDLWMRSISENDSRASAAE